MHIVWVSGDITDLLFPYIIWAVGFVGQAPGPPETDRVWEKYTHDDTV